MKAELIVIGDEILIGQIVDTNSSWICSHLGMIGVNVRRISAIADDRQEILDTLTSAAKQVDLVVMTGGLGPTKDDVTKEALLEYFNTKLLVNTDVLAHVREIFERYNRPMPLENRKQAEVLEIAEVMFNKAGTAPGMWIDRDGVYYAILPGVPTEMKYLMNHEVIPRLTALPGREVRLHKTILTAGIGESFLAETIAGVETVLPEFIHLAYLPTYGQVRLRLTASGHGGLGIETLNVELNKFAEDIKNLIPMHYINDTGESLQYSLLKIVEKMGYTIAAAESCTGGYFSHLMTLVPGSGQVFLGSVISYAESVKEAELGV